MVLTDTQRAALQDAVLEYLCSDGQFSDAASAFAAALDKPMPGNKGGAGVLEKKWTSVVRLQRNVLALETKVKELEAERKNGFVSAAAAPAMLSGSDSFMLKSTAKERFSGHRGSVSCVALHPRYNLCASGSEDATVKIWDFETGDFERTLKGHTNAVQDCCFSPDGLLLATCSADMSVKLWDFSPSGQYACVKTLMGHDHNVSGVGFFKDGKLVSCSRDKTLKVWDANSGYCLKTLVGHEEWVRKVAVHQDSGTVASCSNDHNVMVWNPLANNAVICTLVGHEHVVECVAFASPKGEKATFSEPAAPAGKSSTGPQVVVSGSRDRSIKVWSISAASCLFSLSGHDNWVRGLAFQPNGKYLISVSEDKSIRTWDLSKRTSLRTISAAHKHFITSCAIHSQLAVVATGSVDSEVAVWVAAPQTKIGS